MDNVLNIYKCSGLGSLGEFQIYNYWTANTSEFLNTIAFNEQLSEINLLMTEYDFEEDNLKAAALASQIDIHILILQGLKWNMDDKVKYPLEKIGAAIDSMIKRGQLEPDLTLTDDQRASHLEGIVQELSNLLEQQDSIETSDSEFIEYFNTHVIAQNENNMPDDAKERFNEWFANPKGKIGDVKVPDPKDYKTLSDYIKGCGGGFLYLWIDDIEKYNATIRRRRDKEEENLNYIVNNCGGIYSRQQVINTIRQGIIETYGKTPEARLKELQKAGDRYLKNGGKIGEIVTLITTIITAIVAILTAVLACIQECAKAKYNAPDNYSYGVPREGEDFNIGAGQAAKKSSGTVALLVALGAAALLFFRKDKRQ